MKKFIASFFMWFIFDLLSRHGNADQGQHDRHFGQDTDRRRQGSRAGHTKEAMATATDSSKKLGCPDESCPERQCRRAISAGGSTVGNEENKEGLQSKGYGDEQNVNGIRQDDLG